MGKIKSKAIKKTGNTFVNEKVEFSEDFEENKKILGNLMPSKKIRNQMAGFLSRLKKQQKKNQVNMPK